MALKFTHIINAVPGHVNVRLEKEQALTMQCMVSAKSRYSVPAHVELMAVTFSDEKPVLPEEFVHRPSLTRSVQDLGLNAKKRLPFLKDILETGATQSHSDYFIYTNADICVVPDFYNVVARYIEKGHDAIVINRRRVSETFLEKPDFQLMFAETGRMHTGYDCFIFHASLLEKFILTDVCIGVPPACNDLFHNVFCFAKNPVLYTEKQLTYHIGMELYKNWGGKKLVRYNYKEMKKIMQQLRPHFDISKFPGAELPFFKRHYKWCMNPTLSYPLMFGLDFKQWRRKRKPRKKPEVKGLKQRFLEWLIQSVNFRD